MSIARSGLLALALASACEETTGGGAPPNVPEGPSGPPHVVVSIVVDQLGAWVAADRFGELPSDGGFARLRREGTYAEEMRYAHAVTDTAPGHSALYTGEPPRVTGIDQNEVIDAKGDKVSVLADDRTRLVGAVAMDKMGSSLRVLRGPTVADRFVEAHPDALIVSLSLKDRGALFAAGRSPAAAVWLDKKVGWVTSTAFTQDLPGFVKPLAFPMTWEPLDAAWVKGHAKTPDDQAGEGDLAGLGTTFPHAVTNADAFRATPLADAALIAMAEAAIAKADRPTLLALSLSANDYVGHVFGPDSWEAWDELRRLDAQLAGLFAWLDRTFGAEHWDAILAADHGVTTMPEAASAATRPWCATKGGSERDRWHRACGPVGRIMPKDVGSVIDPYVDVPANEDPKAVADKLRARPGVDRVIDVRTLPNPCPPEADESVEALVCRAVVPESTAHAGATRLYVVTKPGYFFDPDVVPGKGTSHGSPWPFDRAVPLLVRAPGRAAAGRVIHEPISFRAFARTLSTLLGVDPSSPETARAPDLARHP